MKKAICFTAIIAAAIAGQAQARPAPVFTAAELAAFLQGAPLKKTGIEGLRARDLDVIERLRGALRKRYGAFIGDAEVFISRGLEAGRVFYRIDFSGLASPDHARALCMAMRLDQCGIIDEASGTVVLEPVLTSLAGRPARAPISAPREPAVTRPLGVSPPSLDPSYSGSASVAPKNPCAGGAAFFACDLPDWARRDGGKDGDKNGAAQTDALKAAAGEYAPGAAAAVDAVVVDTPNPGWVDPEGRTDIDGAPVASDPAASDPAASDPAGSDAVVAASTPPSAIMPNAVMPDAMASDPMASDPMLVDPMLGDPMMMDQAAPGADDVSNDNLGESGVRPDRSMIGEAPFAQPLPEDASSWVDPDPSAIGASAIGAPAGASQDDVLAPEDAQDLFVIEAIAPPSIAGGAMDAQVPQGVEPDSANAQGDGVHLVAPQMVAPQIVEPQIVEPHIIRPQLFEPLIADPEDAGAIMDDGMPEEPAMDVEGRFMGIHGAPDDVAEAGGVSGGFSGANNRDFIEIAMTMISSTAVAATGAEAAGDKDLSEGAAANEAVADRTLTARPRAERGTAPSFLVGLRPYPDDATDYFTPRPLTLVALFDTSVARLPGGFEPDDASDLLLVAERATSGGEEQIAQAAASLRAMFASPGAGAQSAGVAFDDAVLARVSTGIRIAPPEPTETAFSVVSIDDAWVEAVADPFSALPPQALKTPRLRPEARMAEAKLAQRMTPEMVERVAAARRGSEGFRLAVMMPDTTAKRIMMAAAPAGLDERRRLAALLPAGIAAAAQADQSSGATVSDKGDASDGAQARQPRAIDVAQALPARPGLTPPQALSPVVPDSEPAPQGVQDTSNGGAASADTVRRDALDVINRAADQTPSVAVARPQAAVAAPATVVAVAPATPPTPTVSAPAPTDFADMARRLNGVSSAPAPFAGAPRPERAAAPETYAAAAPEVYAPRDAAAASQGDAARTGNARLGLGMGLPDQPARPAPPPIEPIVYDALGENYDWVGRGEGAAPLAAPTPAYGARQAPVGQMQPGQVQSGQTPPPTTIVTDQYGRPLAPAGSPLAGLMGDQIPTQSRIGGIVERSVAPPAPQISIADLRLELSYLSRREDIAQRVAQIRAFLPPVMLEKGRFYAMEAPGAPGIYVVGLQANGLTERDDLVWYFGQVGLKYAFRR